MRMKVATKIRPKPTEKLTLTKLQQEVALLRSAVISLIGEDTEGEYRPEFVESILKTAKEQPEFTYTGRDSLLKQLKNYDAD